MQRDSVCFKDKTAGRQCLLKYLTEGLVYDVTGGAGGTLGSFGAPRERRPRDTGVCAQEPGHSQAEAIP